MSMSHLIILGIIALIVIPPDKLPEMARQLAKFIYDLKRMGDSVMNEIKQEALFKPDDIIDQKIKDQFKDLQSSLTNNVQSIQSSIQNLQTPASNPPAAPVAPSETTVTGLPPVVSPTNPAKPTDGSEKS